MSEHQVYEFVALDRPLTQQQMAELRAISSRAEITRTRFWNEYEWGDLKADPAKLLSRYFDALLYFANWGTRRFMLRLPAARVDVRSLKAYFPGRSAALARVGAHVVVDFWSENEEPEDDEWSDSFSLGALTPLRRILLDGDLAPAYIAWLLALQSGDVKETASEPRVPDGIADPSAPLVGLMDFLRIDEDLLSAAAEARVPTTARELLRRADEHRSAREHKEAEQLVRARAKAAALRRTDLAEIAAQGDLAWQTLERLVFDREYDEAVRLTIDLRDIARAAGTLVGFDARLHALKKRHPRRRGYLSAIKRRIRALAEADE